jgi:hypothetical protein
LKYEILQDRIASISGEIKEINHRDRLVYRPLFSSDTLNIKGIYTPYPSSKYASLTGDEYSEIMISTWRKLDAVTRQTYAASRSLDELQILAKDKEQMALAIPAIWPIDRTRLRAFYAFGQRQSHPIYGTRAMHKGVDLSAEYGSPVFATGDGIVEKVDQGQKQFGYGQQILIDHKLATRLVMPTFNECSSKGGRGCNADSLSAKWARRADLPALTSITKCCTIIKM